MEVKIFLEKKGFEERKDWLNKIQNKSHRNTISDILEESNDEFSNQDELKNYLINGYNDFLKYRHLMKNEHIEFERYFYKRSENLFKSFENFNDDVQKAIIKNKAQKLKHRIISNKYKYLCDEKTDKLFLEMAQMEFSKQELQDFVGKKIAAFHYSEELNGALMNLIDIKAGWDSNSLLNKLNKSGCEEGKDYIIHLNQKNKLLIEAKTFKTTQSIGSKMWCISREKQMFNHYKQDTYIDYQLYYDFDKNPSDDMSMIAMLVDLNYNLDSIYTKGDKEFLEEKSLSMDYEEILEKTFKELKKPELIIKRLKEYGNNEYFGDIKGLDLTEDLIAFTIFDTVNDYSMVLSKKEMEKYPDVFDLKNINTENYSFIDDSENLKRYIAKEIMYNPNDELFSKIFKDDFFDKAMKNKKFKSLLLSVTEKYMLNLLDAKRFEKLEKYINTFKQDIADILIVNNYQNKLSGTNIFHSFSKNDKFIDYLKNKKSMVVNELYESMKENYDSQNEKIERDLPLVDFYLKESLVKTNKKEHLDNLKYLVNDSNNLFIDMDGFDYSKTLYMRTFYKKDVEIFNNINMEKEGKRITEVIFEYLFDDLIENTYKHPRDEKEMEELESGIINYIDFLDKNNLKEEKSTNSLQDMLSKTDSQKEKEHYFSKYVSNSYAENAFKKIWAFDLVKEENTASRVFYNIIKKMALKTGKKLDLDNILSGDFIRYANMNNEINSEHENGLKFMIKDLHENNLLNLERYKQKLESKKNNYDVKIMSDNYEVERIEKNKLVDIIENILKEKPTKKLKLK